MEVNKRQFLTDEIDQQLGTGISEHATRRLLDEDFPDTERLPRHMDAFIGEEEDSKRVVTFVNGVRTGDALSDNRYDDDGYRFHDVFHLAYASLLGWSPTIRALMRHKRKSVPAVDEVEDGGRAITIEEGIVAMVFSYAEHRSFLEGVDVIDHTLLRTIKEMTAHLEVSCRSEGDWENAIMTGFGLWRDIRAKGEGRIQANLETGTIELVN